MRSIQHAFLSVVRKPTKGIVIFLIFLMVFTLIFTSIIIQNTIKASKDFTRKELGGNVEMKVDFIKAMNDVQGASSTTQTDTQNQLMLSRNVALSLAEDSKVTKLHIENIIYSSTENLQSAQSNEDGLVSFAIAGSSEGGDSFVLNASNQLKPLDFEKQLKLVEGAFRTANDKEKDTVLMSRALAAKNKLRVGDSVKFKMDTDGEEVPFEIIGLFEGGPSYMNDQLYISDESIKRHASKQMDDISRVVWELGDPFDIPIFLEQYKDQMPSEYLYLDASNQQYNTLTKPLDVMSTVFSMLMVVIFIAGAMITIAIVTLFVRERQFEIGLLLANGEKKVSILAQFSFEILMVAVLAFIFAFVASAFTADFVASWISVNQLIESRTDPQNMIFFGSMMDKPTVTMQSIADAFKVSIDFDTVLNLGLVSLGLLLAAIAAPLSVILSYKPRKSLQN